jgi:hypothetical protein
MVQIPVTTKQVLAARVRIAGDKALKRETPAWIVKLSQTPLPASSQLGHSAMSKSSVPDAREPRVRGQKLSRSA